MTPLQSRTKRATDLVLGLVLLVPSALLVGIAAFLIVLTSPGNPLYRQERIGAHGRPYRILKLRTMVLNAEFMGAGLYSEKDDPRILRVGKLLRITGIDELPQLVQVIGGTMSLVGPRPLLPVIYKANPAYFEIMDAARPGLTGLCQVEGRNSLTRSERAACDERYVRSWSPWSDLAILARSVVIILRRQGYSTDQAAGDVER